MESNNIISAPQILDFTGLYKDWSANHTGSQRDFLQFMTTPSREREEFLLQLGDRVQTRNTGNIAEIVITQAPLKPLEPGIIEDPTVIPIA